jgi:hypothetical protein
LPGRARAAGSRQRKAPGAFRTIPADRRRAWTTPPRFPRNRNSAFSEIPQFFSAPESNAWP